MPACPPASRMTRAARPRMIAVAWLSRLGGPHDERRTTIAAYLESLMDFGEPVGPLARDGSGSPPLSFKRIINPADWEGLPVPTPRMDRA